MKKDLIFAPAMLLIAVSLFMLKLTDLAAHIAISAVGVVVLIAYTLLTKKEWKLPILEVIMRAFYGVALISGVLVMNLKEVLLLAILHKISAAVFALLLIVLFIYKLFSKKEKN